MLKVGIIGGGVSGIMAAIYLKQTLKSQIEVIIFEGNEKPLRKLLATGNGRCNLSNEDLSLDHYDGELNREIETIIHQYDMSAKMHELGLEIKYLNHLAYPYSESAKTVYDVLLYHINHLGISIIYEFVETVSDHFKVKTNQHTYTFDTLILACGTAAGKLSLSYDRAELLKTLHLETVPFVPSLTKMITKEKVKSLKGVRVKGLVTLKKDKQILAQERGEVLFTDYGLSGIAIMNLSRYYQKGVSVHLDLFPDQSYQEIRMMLQSSPLDEPLSGIISQKLVAYAKKHHIKPMTLLKDCSFTITDLKGQDDAQVLKGGVKLSQLTSHFESKRMPHLYVCGEVLNITGDCGGYNLHFAFASAYAVAQDIIKNVS